MKRVYRKITLVLVFTALIFSYNSYARAFIHTNESESKLLLHDKWKFHAGDDAGWAAPLFDDSKWSELSTNLADSGKGEFKGVGWFRIHLSVSSAMFHKTLALKISQAGASEIYFNGKLLYRFGILYSNDESPYDPAHGQYFIELGNDTSQVIAVRYSAYKAIAHGLSSPGFTLTLQDLSTVNEDITASEKTLAASAFISSIFFAFALFHLVLFLFYRKVRSNLYYSIMAIILSIFWLYPCITGFTPNAIFHDIFNSALLFTYPVFFFFMVMLLYSIFKLRLTVMFWIVLGLTAIDFALAGINIAGYGIAMALLVPVSSIESLRIAIGAVKRKKPGAWIIAIGFSLFSLVILLVLVAVLIFILFPKHGHSLNLDSSNGGNYVFYVFFAWAFSIPTSMSIYLASDFARTNKTLALQLVHVKQLAEQNIQKEKEKQQIIEGQKEMLEKQVKEKTAEIQEQKDELEEKNKEITDSITYARRIQQAILPPPEMLNEALGEHVVVYKPKDVVSGDFYWCHATGDKVIFAVADCTGHGVPGAFMSMIGNSILNEVVIDKKNTEADVILNELRTALISTLQKGAGHITRDGMDIALCVWNKKDNTIQYAGANNSLYWVSKGIASEGGLEETEKIRLYSNHLLEIVADKQPIGYQEGKMDVPFTKHIIQLRKGDMIYITSDGYTDQFGGDKNKKFTSKRFREMLASFADKSITEQKQMLEDTIEQWKKYETQTDDICVIGVRL